MNAKCQTNDTQSYEDTRNIDPIDAVNQVYATLGLIPPLDTRYESVSRDLAFGSCTSEYYQRKNFESTIFCTTVETLLAWRYPHLLTTETTKEETKQVVEPSKETEESNEEKTKLYCESSPAT